MRFAAAMVAAICLCRLSASDGKRWWKRPDSWWTWDEWKRYWTYDRLVDYLGDPTEWFFVFAFDAALAAFLLFHFLPFTKNRITTTPSSDSRSSRMIRRRPALGISTKDAGHLLDIIATSDKEGCFTKYVCHLSAREPAKRTPATSSFVAFLQSLPDVFPTEPHSPRMTLMQATFSNGTTCALSQTSCPHNVSSLPF